MMYRQLYWYPRIQPYESNNLELLETKKPYSTLPTIVTGDVIFAAFLQSLVWLLTLPRV